MSSPRIHRFDTFEQQKAFCARATGVVLPRMTFGKKAFFQDLGAWSRSSRGGGDRPETACIMPDPIQGLSFPRALDVLHSSLSLSSSAVRERDLYGLMGRFGLDPEKATQPIVTLSGGEVLLLNFAKAEAMRPVVSKLVACSPIHWLNRRRYRYWNQLTEGYGQNGHATEVALLEGEPYPGDPVTADERPPVRLPPMAWLLELMPLTVVFDEIPFPFHHPASRLVYQLDKGTSLHLASPTLMTGDNGVGKSIFAKIAAGVIKAASGRLAIASSSGAGVCRLLFQDAIDQIFGQSIDGHRRWTFLFDRQLAARADEILAAVENDVRAALNTDSDLVHALLPKQRRCTLLQAKLSLTAERLAEAPTMIILDEPAWGLSKQAAQAFVEAVCRRAAAQGTAVMIISHQQEWWRHLARSRCHLLKTAPHTITISEVSTDAVC